MEFIHCFWLLISGSLKKKFSEFRMQLNTHGSLTNGQVNFNNDPKKYFLWLTSSLRICHYFMPKLASLVIKKKKILLVMLQSCRIATFFPSACVIFWVVSLYTLSYLIIFFLVVEVKWRRICPPCKPNPCYFPVFSSNKIIFFGILNQLSYYVFMFLSIS